MVKYVNKYSPIKEKILEPIVLQSCIDSFLKSMNNKIYTIKNKPYKFSTPLEFINFGEIPLIIITNTKTRF